MDRSLRVLHILLGLQVGGLERFVQSLIENYSPEIEAFIVCIEQKGAQESLINKVPIFELGKKSGLRIGCIFKIVELIKRLKIDIVHTHNPSPHFYGSIAGFISGVPVVHTKHGRNHPDVWKKVILNRVSSLFTEKIVPVSSDAMIVSISIEKIDPIKIRTILNGIDISRYYRSDNKRVRMEEIGIPISVPVVGIVARLSTEKDHENLFDACKILANNRVEFRLVVVGDGPLRQSLETISRQPELNGLVLFTGLRKDIPELLSEMDLFALASTTEGLSLTLLEAMASSLPIVATRVGGNSEVVLENETGFLVPPRDPKAFAGAMKFLLENIEEARAMGCAGRERVVKMFNIKRTVLQYEELYRECIFKKR